MARLKLLKSALAGGASAFILIGAAQARNFDIPGGDLDAALASYSSQSGIELLVSAADIRGVHTKGVVGDLSADAALSHILAGTGFRVHRNPSGKIGIAREDQHSQIAHSYDVAQIAPMRRAAASEGIESVVVTSSKIKGDIQTVPIAITALSQEQLTSRQIAGGPDLVKEVPNLTFSKTNFTGYNIQIRGIGTQAISVTTDPAVAVAFNDTAFIRNHFFEQEFYDVGQVEVLRGPQGTLYGRNATAGVVNVVSARPTDQFEAMLSADIGNYHQRRYEGMVNIPLVDDRLDVRLAGEWTKRDGYSFNSTTGQPIDGRNLWSSRLSIGVKPFEHLQATLIWEHFQENDDRIRSSKQLCKTDPSEKDVGSIHLSGSGGALGANPGYFSQGCLPVSLYSPDAFEVPNGDSLPYVLALKNIGPRIEQVDVYAGTAQSRDLRVIESTLTPAYKAKNDIVELNADYEISPNYTLTSETGFNHDFLYSTEDFNRFNTAPDVVLSHGVNDTVVPWTGAHTARGNMSGDFCDPQLGCTSRLVAEDLSDEHAWQLSQEFRLTSNFSGPLNFSIGANYLHYETEENYAVFINLLTLFATTQISQTITGPWVPGVSDNHQCLDGGFVLSNPHDPGGGSGSCIYIDPNPVNSLNNNGHNYFLSQNPYVLNSYARFAEAYFQATGDLKLIGGIRWTDDKKHFTDIPSEVLSQGWGYPATGTIDQEWNQWTGRAAANWTPKLDFTEQTLVYASYSRGYKAGGANPPGAVLLVYHGGANETANPIHPLTFAPEFVDAYELGTKNTLLDGALTLNGTGFYYNYKGYQISEIVDRTAINLNFDATVKGAELETTWEPVPGLKFSFAGGYEDTRVADGSHAVDLMDRTAGNTDWAVIRPFITQASNCILPVSVLEYMFSAVSFSIGGACGSAYLSHHDPATNRGYQPDPEINAHNDPIPPGTYPGFNPLTAPNNGEGFDKDLGGNELPNAPHYTASLTAEYTLPVSADWAATLHSDFYWQSQSFARIFNDVPYDKIRGYSNVNLALILTSGDGWQVLGYLKNIFDTTAITGDFLNSDDTGLTTNVFLTDPRLFGVRVTKNF